MFWNGAFAISTFFAAVRALRWSPDHVGYNLNENKTATHPRDYWGEWANHSYHPSPRNWRFPFYVLTIDRYLDGDPTNNNANGSVFEHHWLTDQFRFGGDTKGLLNDLDYIQGLGIKVGPISLPIVRAKLNASKSDRHSTWLEARSSIGPGPAMALDPWI